MTPEEFALAIHGTLLGSTGPGILALDPEAVPETAKIERPRNRNHGDQATNVTMQLARRVGFTPRAFAEILTEALRLVEGIGSIGIAGPGFISIRLGTASVGELARTIVQAADSYGLNSSLVGTSTNLEYVLANPTGPVHLDDAHWAAINDSLARLITASGAKVTREYYFSDHGSQIDRFAKSLYTHAMGREALKDGYGSQYTADVAEKVRHGALQAGETDPVTLPEDETVETFGAQGVELMFGKIKKRLRDFHSEFNVFFHEDSLHESDAVVRVIDTLHERGEVFDGDGVVWLRTISYGDDEDRVLIKSDGQAAYFAGDVTYYFDKRNCRADLTIYLLGADHYGYIGRVVAMCQAFGDTPGVNTQVLIGRVVNFLRNGVPVRMSKRAGTIVTLDDLVDVVGVDAARYALVRVSMDSSLDVDLDLLASHMNKNPVYYVRYAHARTRNVACNATKHDMNRDAGFDPAALDTPAGTKLLGVLAGSPAQVAQAVELKGSYHLARYLEQLTSVYHAWYGQCYVTPRGGDSVEPGHVARLWLNDAVTQVLRMGLGLLGVSAPERM